MANATLEVTTLSDREIRMTRVFDAPRDPEKAQRVLQAMLKMQKIEIPALERAYKDGD